MALDFEAALAATRSPFSGQDVAASGVADQVTDQLRGSGFQVEQTRRTAQFARLHVGTADGLQGDVDLGVDWRQDDPVILGVGPVLSLSDAVGNKVSALYILGEARDYLDVDAIRASGQFSDEHLVTAAAERDAGFARYGVTGDQLEAIKTRCTQWGTDLREQSQAPERPTDPDRAIDDWCHRR